MPKTIAPAMIFSMAVVLSASTAMADEWTVVRLRGGVFALESGAWVQLERGSVVSDERVIKSASNGRVTLVRDAETIELGPDTTAQIEDRSGFTTVYNHQGTVGIDAEARNVQHFAVQTPFLAAVVKGTAFTVQTSAKASTVTVDRGTVQVDDEQFDTSVSVVAGEQVSSSDAPITDNSIVPAPADAPKPPAPAAEQPPVETVNTINNGVPGNIEGSDDTSTGSADDGDTGNGNGNGSEPDDPGGNGPGGNGPGGSGPGGDGPGGNGPGGNGPGGNGPGGNGPGGNGPGGNGPGGNGPGGNEPGGNGPGGNGNGNGPGGNGPNGNGPGGGGNGNGGGHGSDDGPGNSGNGGGNGNGNGGGNGNGNSGNGNGNGGGNGHGRGKSSKDD